MQLHDYDYDSMYRGISSLIGKTTYNSMGMSVGVKLNALKQTCEYDCLHQSTTRGDIID